MPVSACLFSIAGDGRELVNHGTAAFPAAFYNDDMGFHEVPWHWHEELEAAVVVRGCCTVAAGGSRFAVREGEGFFINGSVLHGCWDLENSGCLFHSLVFHPRLVGGGLDSAIYQEYVLPLLNDRSMEGILLRPEKPWQQRALEAIGEAWQAGTEEPYGYEVRVRSALSEMVLQLRQNQPGEYVRPDAKAVRDGERIKEMLQYIHSHWREPLDAGMIARSAAISESECLRCFRSTIGTTPIRYLRQLRLRQAAQLLEETTLPVSAVAEGCGFQDVSYFTKCFRESRGITPSAYRADREF